MKTFQGYPCIPASFGLVLGEGMALHPYRASLRSLGLTARAPGKGGREGRGGRLEEKQPKINETRYGAGEGVTVALFRLERRDEVSLSQTRRTCKARPRRMGGNGKRAAANARGTQQRKRCVMKRPATDKTKTGTKGRGLRASCAAWSRFKKTASNWVKHAMPLRNYKGGAPFKPVDVNKPLAHLVDALDDAELKRARAFANQGVLLVTDYSGSGQAERVVRDMTEHVSDPHDVAVLGQVNCARACDVNPVCQKILKGLPGGVCVGSDMTDRLPRVVSQEITDLVVSYKAKYKKALAATGKKSDKRVKQDLGDDFIRESFGILQKHAGLFDAGATFKCEKHEQQCRAYPSLDPAISTTQIRMLIAGMECLDWASYGKQEGSFGKSALAWFTLMWDLLHCRYDVAILECTRYFMHEQMAALLGNINAKVYTAVFSPHMLGVPSMRYRKYMIVTFEGGLDLKLDFSTDMSFKKDLLQMFGRIPSGDGSAYMEFTGKEETRAYVDQLAKSQHMPLRTHAGQRWPMRQVLSKSDQERLKSHKEYLASKRLPPAGDVFSTIDQNPKFATFSTMVPALCQRSLVWSWRHGRLLLPREHLLVMGIPITLEIDALSDRCMRSISGNAMSSVALGAVYLLVMVKGTKRPPGDRAPA